MKKKNKITALILAALMIFAFVSCGKKEDDTQIDNNIQNEQNETEKHPDSLVIALESEPTTLNPYDHAAVTSGYMNQLTYNRLFKFDVDTLEPVPDLCDTFENVDELTWLFKIKEGVKFHDGTVMTADDVKASMEFARQFTSSNKYTSFWQAVEVVDPLTVKVVTNTPYALILSDLAANGNTILPKHLIDEGNDFNLNPVGSGPYKFVEWTLGDHLTFVKNDEYFDAEHMPSITDLTWRIIPEGSSRTIALETGEVDLVIDVESTDVDRLRETEGVSIVEREGTRMNFMAMNNEKAPFNDPLVRKAINCLIDKEAVVEVSANGQGKATVGFNPSSYAGTTDEGADGHSLEKAMEYFKQAGVDPTTLTFSCMAYTDATRRTAEVIQGCLLEAGITMNIESLDFAAFLSRLLDGDYELGIAGYSSTDVLTYMKSLWHSGSIGAANSARINNPELDALIDAASVELDTAKREALISQICVMVNGEAPISPLFTSSVIRAFNSDLQGVKVSASGLLYICDLSWK